MHRKIKMSSRQMYLIVIILLTLCLVGCGVIVTPEPPPTPTPFVMQSLFAGDTCAPPCWFGLTPGVSTYQDVSVFFETPLDEPSIFFSLWAMNGNVDGQRRITNGYYYFSYGTLAGRPNNVDGPNATIRIHNRILYSIDVWMAAYVSLEQVLATLGNPSEVRFERAETYNAELHFVYSNLNMSVELVSEWDECDLTQLNTMFVVDTVTYYSSEAASENVEIDDRFYPALYAYRYNERFVPSDTWETWLNGGEGMSCWDVWEILPQEQTIPTSSGVFTFPPRPTIAP